MIFEGKTHQISDRIIRFGDGLACVDLVRTSRGWVRVGAMPEIAKLLRQAKTPPHYVVVLPSPASQAGDAITGEEFICWSSLDAAKFAGTYVGSPAALEVLYRYLEPALPYTLDAEQTGIARRDWLDTLYCPEPVGTDGARVESASGLAISSDVGLTSSSMKAPSLRKKVHPVWSFLPIVRPDKSV